MKSILLRHFSLAAIALASLTITTSCDNKTAKPAEDSTAQAAKENDVKFDNKKEAKDAGFLTDAVAFYLEVDKLTALAQKRGSANVKSLKEQIGTQDEKGLKAAKDLAKSKQISVPDTASADAFSAYQTLEGKSGADFDKGYCDRLVDRYKKIVASFEKEGADSRDQDIKDWAKTELPNLRKHLDAIFACQKKEKI